MKKTLKLLSLTLSLIMAMSMLGVFGICASAEDDSEPSPYEGIEINSFYKAETFVGETPYGKYEYAVSQYDRACLVKCLDEIDSENLIIPDEIDGKKVVQLGSKLYMGNDIIKTVKFPSGLQFIDEYAFDGCTGLQELNLPQSVYSLEENAFGHCINLTEVTVPDGVIDMVGAFDDCCNLEEITLGKKVKWLQPCSHSIFKGCSSLKRINVVEDNPYYKSIDGVLFDKEVKTLIRFPVNKTMLESTGEFHCTQDEDGSIYCDAVMKEVSQTTYCIPQGVESIATCAFSEAYDLNDIVFPESIKNIKAREFIDTPWYNNLPDGVVYIQKIAYCYKGEMPENTKIVIKDGITKISDWAFANNANLTSVVLPDSLTKICYSAFEETSLTNVIIPDGVTEIEGSAFDGCRNLKKILIPKSVTSFGFHALGYDWTTRDGWVAWDLLDTTVYCYKNSEAQRYAEKNGLTYVLIDEDTDGETTSDEDSVKGDINGDGVLDITDVVMARSYIVGNIELTPEQISSGDMNGDGEIGIIDVVAMRSTIVSGVKQDIEAKSVTDLDLAFLKLENEKKTKI